MRMISSIIGLCTADRGLLISDRLHLRDLTGLLYNGRSDILLPRTNEPPRRNEDCKATPNHHRIIH